MTFHQKIAAAKQKLTEAADLLDSAEKDLSDDDGAKGECENMALDVREIIHEIDVNT